MIARGYFVSVQVLQVSCMLTSSSPLYFFLMSLRSMAAESLFDFVQNGCGKLTWRHTTGEALQ